jgi:hypothetical protein
VQDFAILLEAHTCADRRCSRRSHTQLVLVSPDDVASPVEEIKMLVGVRDRLAERGFQMLEGEPTPRFDVSVSREPKPWAVRFESSPPASTGSGAGSGHHRAPGRFAALRKLW